MITSRSTSTRLAASHRRVSQPMQIMKKNIRTIFIISIVVLFIGLAIYQIGHTYKGDGRFTDNGYTTAHDRYILDLGEIDLASKRKYAYTMSRLPSTEMTVGFYIEGFKNHQRQSGTPYPANPNNALVRLLLTNDKGNLVINETANLSQWVWSDSPIDNNAFVYLRGVDVKRSLSKGSDLVTYDRVGIKTDDGWGTYFTPSMWTTYYLTIEIIEPTKNAIDYKASVRLIGGGWK